MPSRISDDRYARSFVTPTGAGNEVSRVLDFQLAADQGIEIDWVMGWGNLHDDTPPTSDTVPFQVQAGQSLHLEDGTTEDMPDAAGEDEDDLDTEIFFYQSFVQQGGLPATVGGYGVTLTVQPNGLIVYPKGVISPRNITHKGTTKGADQDLECGVLFSFHFVKFSSAEQGGFFARR